jgi:uncharacterized protein YqgV (UPF0045/DUF77 family)
MGDRSAEPADGHVDTVIGAEFLVEPFVEGAPGPHVAAAVDAFLPHGIDVELGPFASSAHGDLDAMADALADMVRAALREGAASVQIRVGATPDTIPVPSLHDALDELLRAAERAIGRPASTWAREGKHRVVRMLHERGAFRLRGAVDDIAEIMGVSRITIYNYLNAIYAEPPDRPR